MAITKGGFRRTLTYKLSTDTALSNTVVQDISGGSGSLFYAKVVAGASDAFVKFYNADPATAGTTVPLLSLYCKASQTTSVFIPGGLSFDTSISLYMNGNDADVGTVAAAGHTASVTIVTN